MIHTYKLLDRNILLDINSGAVHEIDEITRVLLEQIEPPMSPEPPDGLTPGQREAWDELYALQSRGLLFAPEGTVPLLPEDTPLKALCLHVAHDCNMRCGYCFASTGDFGGARELMRPEAGEKAIDYLLARCKNRRNLEIDFFGGEPLMAMDTVKHVVEYARKSAPNKNFRFTLTTNGLLLSDEYIEYINENMDNIVLSLDGRPEINNTLRKTVSGGGSYELIVPKYKKLLSTRKKDYFIRGTFTAHNLDFAADIEVLEREGFRNLSLEPVVLPLGHPLAITEEMVPRIKLEYEKLLRKMLDNPAFSFFHFQVDLAQGPCVYKRRRGCGAGYEYAAVTPEGDVYPCHQFAGQPQYRLGNVWDGTLDAEISARFKGISIETRSECQSCWAKFYCSGGCSASNLTAAGDINQCYSIGCELERKRLECAILLKAAAFDDDSLIEEA